MNADDAQAFVEGKVVPDANKPPGEQKYYAVQAGKVPGVYTDWPTAQQQISGFKNPRHKKFPTKAEAEAFVNEGKARSAYDSNGISPEEEIRRLIVKQSVPGMIDDGDYVAKDKTDQTYELARGPLPPGAEDGFDPNIKLEPDGLIRNRTLQEKSLTKTIPKESDPPSMLKIYTDGSSLNNGQVGARAGVGVYFGPAPFEYDSHSSTTTTSPNTITSGTSSSNKSETPLYTIDWQERGAPSDKKKRKLTWRYRNISEALKGTKQTNQRAELTAIQRALDVAPSHRDVTIFTDSRYSIDCVTNWYKNWEKNGWLNSRGKPVENRDLVQEVRERINERDGFDRQTLFVWVKGHSTDQGNIEADRLAVEGARRSVLQSSSVSQTDNETGTADDGVSESEDVGDSGDDDPEAQAAFQLRKEALDAEDTKMS